MFVSRLLPAVLALPLLWQAVARPAEMLAQTATLRVEENLRAAPNDVVLGVLSPGAEFAVTGRQEGWVEVEVEGWVWIRSLQVTDRDGFDLVIVPEEAAAEHENLRARPAGPIVARLARGALLDEAERIPGWVRVRRRAWVWARSVQVEDRPEPSPTRGPPAPAALELARVGARGLPVLAAPDGDTVARATPGADLTVLARQGSWARVRLEGWAWMPDTSVAPREQGPPQGPATPDAVAADPLAWRGRIVSWDLQFISLERAEAVRTDFYEGEPFLLTRPVAGTGVPFVYVAIPPERLAEAQGLTPLERITVRGRIRVGSSALTGSPVVDLLELRRGTGRGGG